MGLPNSFGYIVEKGDTNTCEEFNAYTEARKFAVIYSRKYECECSISVLGVEVYENGIKED